jgi:hypothetical protein
VAEPTVHYCCANDLNVGDFLSMLGVQALLDVPGRELLMQGSLGKFKAALDGLERGDVLVIGGGGLLKDHFAKYWDVIFAAQDAKALSLYNFGIGVCDIKGKSTILDDARLSSIAERCEVSVLRPEVPASMVGHPRVRESFCPSEYFVSARHREAETPASRRLLYVDHEKLVGPEVSARIKQMLRDVCMRRGLEYGECDNMIRNRDYESCLALYREAAVVVTTRLHGYILAHGLGLRAMAISNDRKIDAYAHRLQDTPPLPIDVGAEELERRIFEQDRPALDRHAVTESLRQAAVEIRQLFVERGLIGTA